MDRLGGGFGLIGPGGPLTAESGIGDRLWICLKGGVDFQAGQLEVPRES